jgi:hypothetical protein
MLDRWLEVYRAVCRRNGAEPDAGRYLEQWAVAAGLGELESSSSTWRYATPDERAWWGGLWADRVTMSAFAEQAVEYELASAAELQSIAVAFRRWSASSGGWFEAPSCELLGRA